ncbi:MAG: TonB family protein [Smithella sp.]|jgi:TonB family protein|nr:TonB family protein [Smithella sp.]
MTSREFQKSSSGSNGTSCNMFFASLALHLIVFAAIVITVPGTSKQLTFVAPYSVALVGPEILRPQRETGTARKVDASVTGGPVILKRSTVTADKTTQALRKQEEDRSQIEKAIEAIREKEQSRVQAGSPAGAPSGDMSRLDEYSRFVWLKIKQNWTLPASLMPGESITTVIEARIGQSGALEHAGFEKRSGNRYFDDSALRAVQKSAPFPPLKGWTDRRVIEIGIRFHSDEFR